VNQGADLQALDPAGKTPAEVARKNKHPEIARYLRSAEKK
jgi:hypothetical protein